MFEVFIILEIIMDTVGDRIKFSLEDRRSYGDAISWISTLVMYPASLGSTRSCSSLGM
jgi:hypothetical protein